MNSTHRIAVIGAGSWGTALANLLAHNGHDTTLWAYEPEVATAINTQHENTVFLPGHMLHPALRATSELSTCAKADTIVLVTPSQVLRHICQSLAATLDDSAHIVCCSKGIETATGALMSGVLADTLPAPIAQRSCYLSGPSFAIEVATEDPTAVVIASHDTAAAEHAQQLFRNSYFMTFTHHDVIGVELGGALKNVIAIASGIATGLGLGHNTRAAIVTRGLYEIMKVGAALGAEALTFSGLSGIGDLMLTCNSTKSRNFKLGEAIGQGQSAQAVLAGMTMVAEGAETSRAVQTLVAEHQINAPICTAVYRIIYEQLSPQDAMRDLLSLELGGEHRGLER